jgi:hypothetical protein
MKKTIYLLVFWLVSLCVVNGQDTIVLANGEYLYTRVVRTNQNYVVYRSDGSKKRLPFDQVDVRLSDNFFYRKSWSLSLYFGSTFIGSEGFWRDVLIDNGFNYAYRGGFFSSPSTEDKFLSPATTSELDYQFQLNYRYRPQRSFGGRFYEGNSGTITGYNASSFRQNRLEVKYASMGLSVYHQWFLEPKNRISLYLGPSLNRNELTFREFNNYQRMQGWELGLIGGLQLSLIETPHAYFRFNIEYTHMPLQATMPFDITVTNYLPGGGGQVYTETVTAIPAEESRFNFLSIGMMVGYRW